MCVASFAFGKKKFPKTRRSSRWRWEWRKRFTSPTLHCLEIPKSFRFSLHFLRKFLHRVGYHCANHCHIPPPLPPLVISFPGLLQARGARNSSEVNWRGEKEKKILSAFLLPKYLGPLSPLRRRRGEAAILIPVFIFNAPIAHINSPRPKPSGFSLTIDPIPLRLWGVLRFRWRSRHTHESNWEFLSVTEAT